MVALWYADLGIFMVRHVAFMENLLVRTYEYFKERVAREDYDSRDPM